MTDESKCDSRAFIERALMQANPNVLRLSLYQATRDPELLTMRVTKDPVWGGAFQVSSLGAEHMERIREKASSFLRAGSKIQPENPSEDEIRRMMELFEGEPVNDFIFNLGRGDLIDEEFPLGVRWTKQPPEDVKQGYRVAIIGAGFAGIAAAIQLSRLGIPYVVIERNSGLGGTWFTNNYPQARVDVPSHHYQYSFTKRFPWKHYFAVQKELADYAEYVATKYGIKENILFETEVIDAKWDEGSTRWQLGLRRKNGNLDTLTADVVISAAGLFNEPNIPEIPGLDSFLGQKFHSTKWDHSYDYTGKRIGQIGVGSTGAQLMPDIACKAAHLTIYQRSPQWLFEIPGYRAPVSEEVQWLFDHVPYYWGWYSYMNLSAISGDPQGLQDVDTAWQSAGGKISQRNDLVRDHYIGYIRSKVGDNPELMKKLTPDFPPLAKRPVVDNGWFDALSRKNVELVTEKIDHITPRGIRTVDGVEREFDLLLLCSGFKVERYLWPVRYEGRGGRSLESMWSKDGARAYLGVVVPEFPNFFIIYGPNAQARSGGLIKWLELWSRYAVKSIVGMIESGRRSIEVKQEVFEDYNKRLDDALSRQIWGHAKSYYVNEHGRQGVMMPWTPEQYYTWVREPNPMDFEFR